MPWKECGTVSERIRFVARLIEGERMTDLCREFGISRKTGYKIFDRYKLEGSTAFDNQNRRPHRNPNKTPEHIVALILGVRQKHPSWGAPKIRDYLSKKHASAKIPAASTIHVILDRHELVRRRKRLRGASAYRAQGTELLSESTSPNELWCADFKGQFRLGNQKYCYPLTITDHFSRYLLCVDGFENTQEDAVLRAFRNIFSEYGLPQAIRTDNGVPFSTRTLMGLSKLSVYWLRLGIGIERIKPGHPEQNGRHERMHLTLKQATTNPPMKNFLQQQELFDGFRETYNLERPHNALSKRTPSELYQRSTRPLPAIVPEPEYPDADHVLRVTRCGSICLGGGSGARVFVSAVLGGEHLGARRIDDRLWSLSFCQYELGFFDEESLKLSPKSELIGADTRAEAKSDQLEQEANLLPMSPE